MFVVGLVVRIEFLLTFDENISIIFVDLTFVMYVVLLEITTATTTTQHRLIQTCVVVHANVLEKTLFCLK
jgi:hypothetical protein